MFNSIDLVKVSVVLARRLGSICTLDLWRVPVLGGTFFVENSHFVRPSAGFFFGFLVGPGTFST